MVSSPTTIPSVEVNLQDIFGFLGSPNWESSYIMSETWQEWVQTWLQAMKPNITLSDAYELSLRLTSNQEIQALNAQYRQKDQPTDVLAFAALEVDVPQYPMELAILEPLYLGDIIISVETASKQAQQNNHSLRVELAWLATHGLLHLLGWDHPNEESLQAMLSQQKNLLKLVGLQANI